MENQLNNRFKELIERHTWSLPKDEVQSLANACEAFTLKHFGWDPDEDEEDDRIVKPGGINTQTHNNTIIVKS